MNHVSFDTAKKLKDAGLIPKFERWQRVYLPVGNIAMILDVDTHYLFVDAACGRESINKKSVVWAPGLEELLSEIEKYGYGYALELTMDKKHCISVWHPDEACGYVEFTNTSEDAAASALLWVLKQGKGS